MFDARTIKLLATGDYLTATDYPGLRIEAKASRKTWIYRYRSPVDNRLRQVKIGVWPEKSIPSAIAAWEELRKARDAGEDAAEQKRAGVQQRKAEEAKRRESGEYTVRDLCDDYLAGHIKTARKKKGADEVERIFNTMLGGFGSVPAATVTRTQAFDLIKEFSDIPVQAANLRAELGAAWDYALDAGRLPDTVPNWWRLILRGKIKSKGKKICGVNVGTAKRFLSDDEAGELIRWLPNMTALVEDVLTIYLWTGARGAEIVHMEGREIKEEGGIYWWTQAKEKTKNARHERAADLRLPVYGRALTAILRRKALYGESYLFPAKLFDGRSEPVKQKSIQAIVYYHQPYSQTRPELNRLRFPVSHWAPHDLRRTARTMLAALGCPSDVGETILGHMLPGMEGIYNRHAFDPEKVIWLKKLSAHLEQLAQGGAAS
jgi:integrase